VADNTASITTAWRDEPLLPGKDDDLATLVRKARAARGRTVGFDWRLSPEELRCLRQAVHHWGSTVRGRYKLFDARVLAAINAALDEPDSAYVLVEPRASDGLPCAVQCVRVGPDFRLHGYAPFDVVWGYGAAATDPNPGIRARIGANLAGKLAAAVDRLGWSVERFSTHEARPVRNALYGLKLGYGIKNEISSEPSEALDVRFLGPFHAVGREATRCLFNNEVASEKGIYLWTIPLEEQERVWYVGQTRRSFGRRMAEHVQKHLSGEYPVWDPEALVRGEHRFVWPPQGQLDRWPATLPAFLARHGELVPVLERFFHLVRFYVAPLPADRSLLDRVEGAVGRYLRDHEDAAVRDFVVPGLRVPARIPGDTSARFRLSSEMAIRGLPAELIG